MTSLYENFCEVISENKQDLKKSYSSFYSGKSLYSISDDIEIIISIAHQPFFIHSLKLILEKYSFVYSFINHPTFYVLRNSKNEPEEISQDFFHGAQHEMLVYIKGNFIVDLDVLKFLDCIMSDIKILEDQIKEIVLSWPNIKTLLNEVINQNCEIDSKICKFLQWLQDGNFTFFGVWHKNQKIGFSNINFKSIGKLFGKIELVSNIYKSNKIDYIDLDGTVIFGLYTTAVQSQSPKKIPILQDKIVNFIKSKNFIEDSYNAKQVIGIAHSLPKDFLLTLSDEDFFDIFNKILKSINSKTSSSIRIEKYLIIISDLNTTDSVKAFLLKNGEIYSEHVDIVMQDFHIFLYEYDGSLEGIEEVLLSWREKLILLQNPSIINYGMKFPEKYQRNFGVSDIQNDINLIFKSKEIGNIYFFKNNTTLKIFGPKLAISDVIPKIENLGLRILNVDSFKIDDSSNLDVYYLEENNSINLEVAAFALYLIDKEILANDSFLKLITLLEIKLEEIIFLRALTRYLHQTGFIYGKGYVQLTLIKHYNFTMNLVKYFQERFEHRENRKKELLDYITKVSISSEDKVLRAVTAIVSGIVRTNYFDISYPITKHDFQNQPISFKISSRLLSDYLPLPLPYAEIYVYSYDFEGIHLRGGKIARGGIRWSDRSEDYRTEVLGLMKAQMTKNSVIVPVGSKGGFVLRKSRESFADQKEYMQYAVNSYKSFLSAMLSITDNYEKIEKSLDEYDPYLVVAADKGTASFSDYANEISLQHNFWLKDAFASGGSFGYDHKKMAITARGAWISVMHHLKHTSSYITTVGIGDMSGDVFGNGMLMSNKIKLLAAFNHMHIFIDPNPDAEKSFLERKRLFEKPGSTWLDYCILSEGGKVFNRSEKFLKLSPEIMNLFNIQQEEVSPEAMIKIILTSKVDLIWNGGIGNYIKASNEVYLDDKTNDLVRVNASDVKAKVIAEGGNLGVSQLGRIEFAKKGGLINTDFIDNSGGVDCSDHEVNIKIALEQSIKLGEIFEQNRNSILLEMTDEVADLVLQDNLDQNIALSLADSQIEMFIDLITKLEDDGLLDRTVEFLPKDNNITYLSRPEIAILLSYSKMYVYKHLANSKIFTEEYFESYLISYFPKFMQQNCKRGILSHPLRTEIINTVLTNEMVNRMGGENIIAILKDTGSPMCDLARSYVMIKEIFEIDKIWKSDLSSLKSIQKILRRGTTWMLRHFSNLEQIEEIIAFYKDNVTFIKVNLEILLSGNLKSEFEEKSRIHGKEIVALEFLISAFDISYICKSFDKLLDVASLYFKIGEDLHLDFIRSKADYLRSKNNISRVVAQAIKDNIYEKQVALTEFLLNVESWESVYHKQLSILNNSIDDFPHDFSLENLVIADKSIGVFLKTITP